MKSRSGWRVKDIFSSLESYRSGKRISSWLSGIGATNSHPVLMLRWKNSKMVLLSMYIFEKKTAGNLTSYINLIKWKKILTLVTDKNVEPRRIFYDSLFISMSKWNLVYRRISLMSCSMKIQVNIFSCLRCLYYTLNHSHYFFGIQTKKILLCKVFKKKVKELYRKPWRSQAFFLQ